MSFSHNIFKSLLELAVTNSFFLFNEQLYRQKEGLGMGLPISPVMANIFMGHHSSWMQMAIRLPSRFCAY